MSILILENAINNTLTAFKQCLCDEPSIERILVNIDAEFCNIKPVVLDTSIPDIIYTNISTLYKTLDKSIIILRYIESFQTYVRVYRKNDIKSIALCLTELVTQFHIISVTVNEIKARC